MPREADKVFDGEGESHGQHGEAERDDHHGPGEPREEWRVNEREGDTQSDPEGEEIRELGRQVVGVGGWVVQIGRGRCNEHVGVGVEGEYRVLVGATGGETGGC